jgi:hypothetical protein
VTKNIACSPRSFVPGIVVAVLAALAGLGVAPRQAVASTEMSGWTCQDYDVCMPGSQPCCFEIAEIPPGMGRCSTMCGGGCAC